MDASAPPGGGRGRPPPKSGRGGRGGRGGGSGRGQNQAGRGDGGASRRRKPPAPRGAALPSRRRSSPATTTRGAGGMDTDATRARPPPRAAADADAEDGEVVMAEDDGAAANALDDGDGDGDDDEPELDLDALRRAALANMHGFAGGGDAPPRASPAAPSSSPFAPARASPNRPVPRAFEPSSLEERAARFAADEVSDDDDDALARADDSGTAAPRPAGTHIVGVCELMCPPSERQLRERKNDIELFERVDPENRCKSSSALCVKKYTRIVDGVTPEMVRTRAALDRTVTHLYGLLDDRPEASFMSKSKFLWDRLRSVRQDLSLQAIADSFAARLLEQMARFAILSEHELCEETATVTNPDGHNSHLNIEQLAKTLTSLRHMYKDRRRSAGGAGGAADSASAERRDDLDAEAEMFAYQLLLRIDSHGRYAVERREMLNDLRGARAEVLTHPDVQLALEANRAYGDGNIVAFFRAVDRATYLQACVLHKYFARVRSKALETMNATYGKQTMSVNELAKHLRCDAEEAEALAAHHGLAVVTKGGAGAAAGGRGRGQGAGAGAGGRRFVALRDAGFVEPAEEFPITRSSLVDAKRAGAFVAEIVGERRRPTPGSPAGAVLARAGANAAPGASSPLRASAAAFTPAREVQAQAQAQAQAQVQVRVRSGATPPPASPSPSKAAAMEALRAKIAATEAAEKKRKERKRAAPAEASRAAHPPGTVSPVFLPADGTPSKETTPESEPTNTTAPESRVRRGRPKEQEPSPKEGAAEEGARRRGDAPPFPSAPVGFTAAPLPATAEGKGNPPHAHLHFGGFAPTPALVRGSAAHPSSEDEASKAAAARSLAAAEATARADAERVAAEAERAKARARAKADADADAKAKAKAKADADAAEAERLRVEAERLAAERLAAERARERRALAAAREREAKRLRRAAKSRAARLALHFARWLANARLLASARLREARLESSRAAASPALAPVPPKLSTSRARAAAGFLSPETSIRRARLAVDAARRRAWGAPLDVSKIARGAAPFAADAGGSASAGGCPRAWKLVADCRRREGATERAFDAASAWLVAKLSRGGAPEPAPGERGRVLSLYADEGRKPDGCVPLDGVTPDGFGFTPSAIPPDGFGFTPSAIPPDGFGFTPSEPDAHPHSPSEPMWVCVREVEVDAGPEVGAGAEEGSTRRSGVRSPNHSEGATILARNGWRGASAGVCALSVSASDADSGGLAWDRSGGALPAAEARRVRRFVAALGRGDLTAGALRAPPPPALFLLAGPASAVGGGGGARAAALVAALVAAEDGDARRAVRVETLATPDEEDATSAAAAAAAAATKKEKAADEKEKENVADAAFARAGAWDAALERGLRWAARAAPPRRAARLARLRDVVADALVFSSAPPPPGSESFPSSSSLDDPAACVRAFDAAVAEARRVVRGGMFSYSYSSSRGGRSADEEGEGGRTPGGLASEFAALASASQARRATGLDADAVAARDALLARARLGDSDDDADDAPGSSGFVHRALRDSFIGRSDATTTDEPFRRKRGVVLRASFRRVFAERLAALDAAETASGLALARVFLDGGGEGGGGGGGGGGGSDAAFFGTRGPASVAAWGAREDEDARRAERKRRRRDGDGDADADEGRTLTTGAGADPDTTMGTPRGHFEDPPDTTKASINISPARPSRAALAPVGSSPPSRETAPLRVAAMAADELDDWLARAALAGAETDENAPSFTLETEAWADDGDVVAKLRKIGEGRVRL